MMPLKENNNLKERNMPRKYEKYILGKHFHARLVSYYYHKFNVIKESGNGTLTKQFYRYLNWLKLYYFQLVINIKKYYKNASLFKVLLS